MPISISYIRNPSNNKSTILAINKLTDTEKAVRNADQLFDFLPNRFHNRANISMANIVVPPWSLRNPPSVKRKLIAPAVTARNAVNPPFFFDSSTAKIPMPKGAICSKRTARPIKKQVKTMSNSRARMPKDKGTVIFLLVLRLSHPFRGNRTSLLINPNTTSV